MQSCVNKALCDCGAKVMGALVTLPQLKLLCDYNSEIVILEATLYDFLQANKLRGKKKRRKQDERASNNGRLPFSERSAAISS
ncbi:hypothetical protein CEXT_501891 [Caerostris extrusa]|uniref:Uncharacterized protein n=1 Tax=Caerostris extrusa TaxID=172846 RepID=A0AAV4XTA2_CAEEX|nr:hypothetical protein CEXT_501891 [Caerostris extrusa]